MLRRAKAQAAPGLARIVRLPRFRADERLAAVLAVMRNRHVLAKLQQIGRRAL
jgi:hypothetical protein